MNTLTLQLRVKRDEGALVRLLSVTRRRRFEVLNLKADSSDDGGFLDVQMTVQADRSGTALVRHIEKLVDVSQVEVIEFGEREQEARAAGSAC